MALQTMFLNDVSKRVFVLICFVYAKCLVRVLSARPILPAAQDLQLKSDSNRNKKRLAKRLEKAKKKCHRNVRRMSIRQDVKMTCQEMS